VPLRVRHLLQRRLLVRKLRARHRQWLLTRLQQRRHLAVVQRRRLHLLPLQLQQ
jgi:hypothetical protein